MAEKVKIDVDGTDIMSDVLRELLNECPALLNAEIAFSTLAQTSGIAFFPSSGAVITKDRTDIVGHVTQSCTYQFSVVYRAAPKLEAQRLKIKEFLDTLGKWLEQQEITIDGEAYKLEAYPALEQNGRKITAIRRTSAAYLRASYEDGVEDWTITLSLKYQNDYDT